MKRYTQVEVDAMIRAATGAKRMPSGGPALRVIPSVKSTLSEVSPTAVLRGLQIGESHTFGAEFYTDLPPCWRLEQRLHSIRSHLVSRTDRNFSVERIADPRLPNEWRVCITRTG